MFEISISQSFRAVHSLRTSEGEFEPLHTHDFKVAVSIFNEDLDANGCVVDFGMAQRLLRECLVAWDGKTLNDLDIFASTPPSTEFISKYIFDQIYPLIQEEGAAVHKVTVWETENCSATYYHRAGEDKVNDGY